MYVYLVSRDKNNKKKSVKYQVNLYVRGRSHQRVL